MKTRLMSFIESMTQVTVGLVISYTFTLFGMPYFFGITFTYNEAGLITLTYFFLSAIRMYIIRRIFDATSK